MKYYWLILAFIWVAIAALEIFSDDASRPVMYAQIVIVHLCLILSMLWHQMDRK